MGRDRDHSPVGGEGQYVAWVDHMQVVFLRGSSFGRPLGNYKSFGCRLITGICRESKFTLDPVFTYLLSR